MQPGAPVVLHMLAGLRNSTVFYSNGGFFHISKASEVTPTWPTFPEHSHSRERRPGVLAFLTKTSPWVIFLLPDFRGGMAPTSTSWQALWQVGLAKSSPALCLPWKVSIKNCLRIIMERFSYQVCSCFLNFLHNYILLLFCITVKHNTCFKLQSCSKCCNSLLRHKVLRHGWSARGCIIAWRWKVNTNGSIFLLQKWLSLKRMLAIKAQRGKIHISRIWELSVCIN